MNRNIKIVAVLVLAIIVMMVGLNIFQNKDFKLTGTTPDLNNTIATSTGTIKLNFNKKIDSSVGYVSKIEGDAEIINSISVEEKTILIKLKPLIKDKKYSFVIKDIKSTDGKYISKIPINFTAKYVPYNKLSSDQKSLELSQTDKNNSKDPILAIVPHQGDQFYLTSEYTSSEDGESIFVLNAQLFLYRSDLGSGRDAAIEKCKTKVRDYLKSNGLNLDNYLVRYEITEPPTTSN